MPNGGAVGSVKLGVRFPLQTKLHPPRPDAEGGVRLYALHLATGAGGSGGVATDWHNALVAEDKQTLFVVPFDDHAGRFLARMKVNHWGGLLSTDVTRVRIGPNMDDNYRAWLWLHVALTRGTLAPLFTGPEDLGPEGAALFELHIVDSLIMGPQLRRGPPPPLGYEARRFLDQASNGVVGTTDDGSRCASSTGLPVL
jgi:hypothetical protein